VVNPAGHAAGGANSLDLAAEDASVDAVVPLPFC
jgi:hypothetical protein